MVAAGASNLDRTRLVFAHLPVRRIEIPDMLISTIGALC